MRVLLIHNGEQYAADLQHGIDLSISVKVGDTVNAYYAHPVTMEPYVAGEWIGSVEKGGPVNYRDIFFSPHGHGTHTECYGHIHEEVESVNEHIKTFHLFAQVISVEPTQLGNGDMVITKKLLEKTSLQSSSGIIIRTKPNDGSKMSRKYSGHNPPYLEVEAVEYLVSMGCEHLILDVPSIDRRI